ncbi:MAG: serine protease [Pseudomonadota bacterium]
MLRVLFILFVACVMTAKPAAAQQQVFIQIEAQPSLSLAQNSLRSYAGRFGDLNGFELNSGWFGIALGPYPEEDAAGILRSMRAAGLIPRDSYIAKSNDFASQFWPESPARLPLESPEAAPETSLSQGNQTDSGHSQSALATAAEPEETPRRETLREARAGEARLTRDTRGEIQRALAWAGFYQGRIDASFGPGTRRAMSRWQEARALPGTGILTTRQRAMLLNDYNALLEGLDLSPIEDTQAGIAMTLPLGIVQFARYEPPFAHYEARNTPQSDLDAQVLLISQRGDRAALAGLYDVLQTLEIVPLRGARQLRADAFAITGQDAARITHIEARLEAGQIKGFALIWPAGDEGRRTRVLALMQESFTRLENVLEPSVASVATERIDLLAGLEIRQPLRTRSGFFIDRRGWVMTTADAVAGCSRVTIDATAQAEVESVANEVGLALLRPSDPLAPPSVAAFAPGTPRLRSEIAVAGYSYGGVLGAPSITFGTLEDLRGLSGEPELKRLALSVLDSDAGGPVLDDGGAVLGLLLSKKTSDRLLPDNVSFAAGPEAIGRLLLDTGITPERAGPGESLPPEILRQQAARMTVLVSCWE